MGIDTGTANFIANSGRLQHRPRGTGSTNTGLFSPGNVNTGVGNTGSINTGSFNTGSTNTGSFNLSDPWRLQLPVTTTRAASAGDYNTGVGNVNTGAFISGNYSNGFFWRGDYQGI